MVGPFAGASLNPKWPEMGDPKTLARWDDGPKIGTLLSELMEGLAFTTVEESRQATLHFTDLQGMSIQRAPVVSLHAPGKDVLTRQLDLVAAYADLRVDRAGEITSQLNPPMSYWASVVGIQPHRHKKTLLVLDIALALAFQTYMRLKHIFAVPRPMELSPQIQPMIPTPGHGALPSGHATEAFVIAHVLEALMNADDSDGGNGTKCREQLQRLAARISINRTVAGLHYPVDSAAGQVLGNALGAFLVARSTGGKLQHHSFDGRSFTGADGAPKDFRLHDNTGSTDANGGELTMPKAPLLEWLWEEAKKEWA